jgi:hypothetical protein
MIPKKGTKKVPYGQTSPIQDRKSVEENGKIDLRAEKRAEGHPGALSVSRSKTI